MNGTGSGEITLRKVEAYDDIPCPSCGDRQIVHHEVLEYLESPALHEAPWASAILYGIDCRCGQRWYDVEISVVPEVPTGAHLLNVHQYKAACYTRYLASRGRREWNLVHLVNVSELVLSERLPAGQSERRFDVPWLDEHNFNMMRWPDGSNSALKLIETMLPVVRRITWPES